MAASLTLCCLSSAPPGPLLRAEPFEDALKKRPAGPELSEAASVEPISPAPRAPAARALEELRAEPWFRGELSRREAEGLLKRDGDFLVRESAANPGAFVLTGRHGGQAKHLLLVDPEGTVSPPGAGRAGVPPGPAPARG